MLRQCRLLLLVVLFAPTCSIVVRSNGGPTEKIGVMNMLLNTEASGSADDKFTKGCLEVTKAFVAGNGGKKTGVARQLALVCSGLQLPLDVEICNRYRSTLLGHLHKQARWNMESCDFPLFCKGMEKVVADHKEEVVGMQKGHYSTWKKVEGNKEEETQEKKEEEKQEKDEDREKDASRAKIVEEQDEDAEDQSPARKDDAVVFAEHGSSDCRCIGIDNLEGHTTVKLAKGNVSFPADLGARCEAWDATKHPDCPGKSWCKQKWCYVDPCKCKNLPSLPKPTTYLPDAKYQGKPVHYSYATCGGSDSFSKKEMQKTAKDLKATCAVKVDSNRWGADNCRCIGIGPQAGVTKVAIKGKMAKFPAHTGAFCQKWEEDRHPECKGDSPPDWCSQAWCYVDPCSCKVATPPKTSSYLPEANYQGKPIYFSYATCGGKDHWTKGQKEACVNQRTSEDCGKYKKCGWTGKGCVGKELASVCKSGAGQKSAESTAWNLKAIVALFLPLLGLLY